MLCPNCGAPNRSEAVRCVGCKKLLISLDAITRDLEAEEPTEMGASAKTHPTGRPRAPQAPAHFGAPLSDLEATVDVPPRGPGGSWTDILDATRPAPAPPRSANPARAAAPPPPAPRAPPPDAHRPPRPPPAPARADSARDLGAISPAAERSAPPPRAPSPSRPTGAVAPAAPNASDAHVHPQAQWPPPAAPVRDHSVVPNRELGGTDYPLAPSEDLAPAEAPYALAWRTASAPYRILALLLDSMVLAAGAAVPWLLEWLPKPFYSLRIFDLDVFAPLLVDRSMHIFIGALALLCVLVSVLSHSFLGASLGKLALGLEVVSRRTGEAISPARAILRSAIAFPATLLGGLGFWWMLVDERSRPLHECLSGTETVFSSSKTKRYGRARA